MTTGPAQPGPGPSREELLAQVEALEQEKRDLEVMLETAAAHADNLSADLEQERNDLATMLQMTTEHADTVEDELHQSAAAALVKSARQLRMIVEATPAPILISRMANGEIVFANVMMNTLVGTPEQAVLGRKVLDLYFDPADRAPIIRNLEDNGFVDHQEVRFKRLDGTLVWVDISLRLLDFNDEPAILSALHDITDRKSAEQRLQKQVEDLRLELEETSQSSDLARSSSTTRFHNLDAKELAPTSAAIIAVHSFRGGNGKTAITANLAGLLAARGQRVGVIDADLQSPGMHMFLGQAGKKIDHTLNDFLQGNCGVHQLAVDVTDNLGPPMSGKVFFVGASLNPGAMAQVLSQGYDAQRLTQVFHDLADLLQLDVLLIDTHPGLNEEALLTLSAVNTLILILRPDAQDLEGTGLTVQIARQLEVPRLMLLVNQLPDTSQIHAVRARVEQTFNTEVAALLPQAAEFMTFDNNGLFALRYGDHPIATALQSVCTRLTGATA